jgi:hypothetical protein
MALTPRTPCKLLEGGEDEEDEEENPSLVTCCRPCRPPCRACMAVRIQAISLVSKDVDCHTMLYKKREVTEGGGGRA